MAGLRRIIKIAMAKPASIQKMVTEKPKLKKKDMEISDEAGDYDQDANDCQ